MLVNIAYILRLQLFNCAFLCGKMAKFESCNRTIYFLQYFAMNRKLLMLFTKIWNYGSLSVIVFDRSAWFSTEYSITFHKSHLFVIVVYDYWNKFQHDVNIQNFLNRTAFFLIRRVVRKFHNGLWSAVEESIDGLSLENRSRSRSTFTGRGPLCVAMKTLTPRVCNITLRAT